MTDNNTNPNYVAKNSLPASEIDRLVERHFAVMIERKEQAEAEFRHAIAAARRAAAAIAAAGLA